MFFHLEEKVRRKDSGQPIFMGYQAALKLSSHLSLTTKLREGEQGKGGRVGMGGGERERWIGRDKELHVIFILSWKTPKLKVVQ